MVVLNYIFGKYFVLYTRCFVEVQKVGISSIQIIDVPTLHTRYLSILLKLNCCVFVCPDCIKEMEE